MSAREGEPPAGASASVRTVVVALGANVGIAVAKLVTALLTRSSAMLAEAVHGAADAGNQVLLLVAERRGSRPPDRKHPLGHGRDAYFWALLAALGVFVIGAVLSVRQGVRQLVHPEPVSSYATAYVVLALALVLESLSLARAYRQISDEARALQREFLEHLDLSSDPIARAVLAEDAAAVAGNVVAFAGIGLHQATGSPLPDALAAIVIGVGLAYVAFELCRRNRQFLLGKEVSVGLRRQVERIIGRQPGVLGLQELLVTFVGPRQVWVLARVEIADELGGAQVKGLLGATERQLRASSRYIARVDLVPV